MMRKGYRITMRRLRILSEWISLVLGEYASIGAVYGPAADEARIAIAYASKRLHDEQRSSEGDDMTLKGSRI